MKIIISNTEFDFDLGCKILKLIHKVCPFEQLEDFWDDIQPPTFKEISQIRNLEERRVAFLHFGLERLVEEVKPKLVDTQTIKKKTTWVDSKGNMVVKKFNDTYELYEVNGKHFTNDSDEKWRRERTESCYFVKCKDTSTDREYLIWVDAQSVYRTNSPNNSRYDFTPDKINAIQAIAWTIQTNVREGNIDKIVRQGDCVLIKPIDSKLELNVATRHLTEKEYRKLLVSES